MKDTFAQRIYQLRRERKMSQAELAKRIGVTQKAIDFWEKSINEPKATYIVKLAEFFNVTCGYILGAED